MKLVTAIVRSEKLDEIIDAVIDHKGRGLTVTTVRGFGWQFGKLTDRTLGADMAAGDLPHYPRPVLLSKARLDIVVLDQDVQATVDAIAKHARTGMIGDGKIWVSDVDRGSGGPVAVRAPLPRVPQGAASRRSDRRGSHRPG